MTIILAQIRQFHKVVEMALVGVLLELEVLTSSGFKTENTQTTPRIFQITSMLVNLINRRMV